MPNFLFAHKVETEKVLVVLQVLLSTNIVTELLRKLLQDCDCSKAVTLRLMNLLDAVQATLA
jgi:hypothetical protein